MKEDSEFEGLLREAVKAQVDNCSDLDLLNLIYGLLISN